MNLLPNSFRSSWWRFRISSDIIYGIGPTRWSKPSTTDNNNTSDSTNPITFANEDEDEAFAKRLQEEAYRANDNTDDNVREADANVHRHETLVENVGFPGFMNQQPSITRPSDILVIDTKVFSTNDLISNNV